MKNQQLYKEVIRLIEAQNINLSNADHFLLKKVVQATKKTIKTHNRMLWFIMILSLLINIFMMWNNDKIVKQNIKLQDKLNMFYIEHDTLISELYKWENHALRMKRICGINDTVQWNYAVKCLHPINTWNLTKHNIKK